LALPSSTTGFAYYDASGHLISVNSIAFAETEESLEMVGPYVCSSAAIKGMHSQGRLRPMTVPEMNGAGYVALGWVHPAETFGGKALTEEPGVSYHHGAFVCSRINGPAMRAGTRETSRVTERPGVASPPPSRGKGGRAARESRDSKEAAAAAAAAPTAVAPAVSMAQEETEDIFYVLMTKAEVAELAARPASAPKGSGSLLSVAAASLQAESQRALDIQVAAGQMFTLGGGGNKGAAVEEEEEDEQVVFVVTKDDLQDAAKVLAYMFLACLFFRLNETRACDGSDDGGGSEACAWSWVDGLYFVTVSISTVGYGDFSPSTTLSRVVTGLIVISGIVLVFSFFGGLVAYVIHTAEVLFFRAARRLAPEGWRPSTKLSALGPDGRPLPAWRYFLSALGFSLVFGVIVFWFVSAWVFTVVQPGLSLGDAIWHCYITSTTVGYGDVALVNASSRVFAVAHILGSTGWLAALIGQAQKAGAERGFEIARHNMIAAQLDPGLIKNLERVPGAGVSQTEFVVGMLVNLGAELCGDKLDFESDVLPLINRFNALDADGSGNLSKGDLDYMMEQSQKAAVKKGTARAGAKRRGAIVEGSLDGVSLDWKK